MHIYQCLPVVSAIVIMLKDVNLTTTEIKQILDQSAKDLGTPGKDIYYGYGKVDAYTAIKLAFHSSSTSN